MADFKWDPTPIPGTVPPPPCHGVARMYDLGSQECRQCSFQNSCRDKIETSRRAGFIPNNLLQQLQVPQFRPMGPQQQQFRPQPAQVQVNVPSHQILQSMTNSYMEAYGRFQDPLQYSIAATPIPARPQLQGETFWERVFKNALLHTLEGICAQLLLAVRQMILPPRPPDPPSINNPE